MFEKILPMTYCSTKLSRRLILSGANSISIKVLNAALIFLISVILARILGPEKYGLYSYAFSLVTIFSTVTTFGFSDLLTREIARYTISDSWSHIRNIIRLSDRIVLLLNILTLTIFILFLTYYSNNTKDEIYTYFFSCLLIPAISFSSLRGGAIRGFGHVIHGQFPITFLRPVIFFLCLLLAYFFKFDLSAQAAMALHLFAGFFALIFGIYYLGKLIIPVEDDNANMNEGKIWIKDSLPFMSLSILLVTNNNIGILMLGWLSGDNDVGIYRVASQTVLCVSFTMSALNFVVAPNISKFFCTGDMKKLQEMIQMSSRMIAITSIPIALLLIIWGNLFINFFFGSQFLDATLPLSVLCMGQIVNTLMGLNGTILNMTKYSSESACIVGAGVLLNVLLNLWLIPNYNAVGAAIATAAGLTLWNILSSIRVYHHLGIRTTIF